MAQGVTAGETAELRPLLATPADGSGNFQWFVAMLCWSRARGWPKKGLALGGPNSAWRNGASDKAW